MGVKDLMAWIKRVHAISSLPARFDSPLLRGQRVAVDGTLLTNRFHFALRRAMAQRGKHALRGWYALINEMRRSDVRPVVIWDERGERPWKAPEARRRLQARAIALSRKLHEDRRAVRLARLKRELVRFGCLSEREREVVRLWWVSRDEGVETALSADSLPAPPLQSDTFILTAYILARLAGHLSRLSWLADAYDAAGGDTCLPTLFEAFEEEEAEVWRIASGLGGDVAPVQGTLWADDSEEIATALEARLRALEPASTYSETARQRALTTTEGEVWDLALEEDELALPAALAQLDALRAAAPSVRETYVSNLIAPLESEHAACRALLGKMGVPVVFARVPYEAEGVAAAMAVRGQVACVGTEDSDVVVYGAPLLRNLSAQISPLVLVDSTRLRKLTGWTDAAFRDFCILLGTDGSPRIPGIGPAAASTLIAAHGSIEGVLTEPDVRERLARLYRPAAEDEATPREMDEFMDTVRQSRKLFDADLLPRLEWEDLPAGDDGDVRQWLAETHGVHVEDPETEMPAYASEEADESDARDGWDEVYGDVQIRPAMDEHIWEERL